MKVVAFDYLIHRE